MRTVFSFRKVKSTVFGYIYRPYADVICYGQQGRNRVITMVVDTGADYTILPRREAAILGIDLVKDCQLTSTKGVGGDQKVYLYQRLQVQLGQTKLGIPVGFLDTNEVPPLLGRHQFMELFKTCFDNRMVSFEP